MCVLVGMHAYVHIHAHAQACTKVCVCLHIPIESPEEEDGVLLSHSVLFCGDLPCGQ